LITAAVFFSVAGFFHEYYLSTLAPPLAALVGIGAVEAWRLRERLPWLAGLLVVTAAALTLALQYLTASAFIQSPGWLPLVAALFVLGAAALLAANLAPKFIQGSIAAAGFATLILAMLVTPGVWSGLTNLHSSDNQSLPAAYDGRSNGPVSLGRTQVNSTLLAYLQANTQNTYYLMAVPSSMQGADYVLATGRPVLYMGGFMGQDQVLTPDSLARLVESGQLRYIYSNATGDGRIAGGQFGGQTSINNWVASNCQAVQGFDASTRNAGAPDGTGGGAGSNGFLGGDMQVSLYDCAK
jgi:4-amino-4-deoxy-L-arabinose transferase-like glycosyltransferase